MVTFDRAGVVDLEPVPGHPAIESQMSLTSLDDACDVWWARSSLGAGTCQHHLLDEREQQRWSSLRRPADRERFAVGRALLRTALAGYTGQSPQGIRIITRCQDCEAAHGKPRIGGSDIEVSVSHSGSLVAVALTRAGLVGVDVEIKQPVRCDINGLAHHVLSAEEHSRHAPDIEDTFFTYWVRKESVLKATGDGLRVAMRTLTVSDPHRHPVLLRFEGRDEVVSSAMIADLQPLTGYAAALTVLSGRAIDVREFDGSRLIS